MARSGRLSARVLQCIWSQRYLKVSSKPYKHSLYPWVDLVKDVDLKVPVASYPSSPKPLDIGLKLVYSLDEEVVQEWKGAQGTGKNLMKGTYQLHE